MPTVRDEGVNMKLQFTNTYSGIASGIEQTQVITIEHEGWDVSKDAMLHIYRQLLGSFFYTLLEDDI